MKIQRIIAAATVGLALAGPGTAALAETLDDMSFSGMTEIGRMDRDRDGMISRQEFLETMGKVWDMHARKMKLRGDRMTPQDFLMIMQYLKAGG